MLAGGAARRLSGVDKALIEIDGISLLRKAIDALAPADDVVVVGPRRTGVEGVRWTREEPAGSGPLAALAAGLAATEGDEVAVLAADLAGIGVHTVTKLHDAALESEKDGAVLVDDAGRRQWLIGVWRRRPLEQAMPTDRANMPLRTTLGTLDVVEVQAEPGEGQDIDTDQDLHSIHTDRKAP